MAFSRTRGQTTTTGTTGTITLLPERSGSDYVEVIGFRCVSTGDTTTTVGLTDADGRVLYLDAATKDYTTLKDTLISQDVTTTGLSITPTDATGAAVTIGLAMSAPAKTPITMNWGSGTSGDVITFDLYYRYPVEKVTVTSTTLADGTNSVLAPLRSEYAQVLGFSTRNVNSSGAVSDTATRVQIADADSRVIYLDAADKDYSTAKIHRLFAVDDTLTGLTPQHLDATGAAATATAAAQPAVVRGPLTLSYTNSTIGDVHTTDVYYRF